MIPRPPRITRTDTLLPYTTRVRSLWVADYGADQVGDGRLFEISLSEAPPPPPPPPPPTLPSVAILDGAPVAQVEAAGKPNKFKISLSEATTEGVNDTYSKVNGTAQAGSDLAGVTGGQATIAAGQLSTNVSITVLDDAATEDAEIFSVEIGSARLATTGTQIQSFDNSGTGTIAASDQVFLYDTTAFGCPDPAGLTFDPLSGRLYLVDSEVDESPFFSSTNMFALDTQGNFLEGFAMRALSNEITGVAYWREPATGAESLFLTDEIGRAHV